MTEPEIRKLLNDAAAELSKDGAPFLLIVGLPGTSESICASNGMHSKGDRDHFHRAIDRFALSYQSNRTQNPQS